MEQNLNQYRIFYTVAKSGSISRASQMLYISQPAVSKAVIKLEEELGAKLFDRNSRGVSLTFEGKILFEQVQTAFEAINAGEEKIRLINSLGIGHLRIGASATFCKYLLLPFLKGFIKEHPHIKITIESQSTSHTLKLLQEGKIDIALVVRTDNFKNLEFYSLGQFQDIFAATEDYLQNLNLRSESSSLSKEEFEVQLFKNANIMLLDEENITRLYVNNYFRMNNIEVNQILEVNNMDLLIEFAKISLGVACVIKEFILSDLKNGRLLEIPLSKPMAKRTAGFAYLKNAPFTDSMKYFMDYVKKTKKSVF
ncbi:MAG TPA: LysR family transcriptional regulator [Oscillospiraceae bacterium]|nr:LysR family transcriptional regulator [Oscillospiraceae bacterium]